MTRLVSSYQVWQAHLREQARAQSDFDVDSPVGRELIADTAARLLFGGSGLTAPYPDDLNAAARQMLDLRAGDLETATLYVISPSMCDVVIAAAQTLTLDDIALLDADDLPSPAGLLLLPHPILVRTITGDLGDDRALAWTTPAHLPTVTVVGVPQQLPGVRVTSYLDTHGPVRPESFRDMAATATAAGTPLPPLLPDGTRTTAYHMTITDDMRAALGDYSRHARTETARWHTLNTDLGFNEGDQVEATFDYHPGDEINDHDDWFTMRSSTRSGACAAKASPTSTTSPPATAPACRPCAPVSRPTSGSLSCALPASAAPTSLALTGTGSTAGSCGCTRSASGTPPNNATRSFTAGPTSKAPPTNPSSAARSCAA